MASPLVRELTAARRTMLLAHWSCPQASPAFGCARPTLLPLLRQTRRPPSPTAISAGEGLAAAGMQAALQGSSTAAVAQQHAPLIRLPLSQATAELSTSSSSGACVGDIAELAIDLSTLPPWAFPAGAAFLLAALIAGVRFAGYSRLQYVTAALLTNRVPRGGARILQLGGSTRDLYYYPNDAVEVTVVAPGAKAGLWDQAGMQAGVPVVLRNMEPRRDQRWAPDASADAVVVPASLPASSSGSRDEVARALRDATRALRPGGALLLVQRVYMQQGGAPLRSLLGGGPSVDAAALEAALEGVEREYESVEVDLVLQGQDPHVVCVALKKQALKGAQRQRQAGEEDDEDDVVAFEEATRKAAAAGRSKSNGGGSKGNRKGFAEKKR